MRSASLWLSLSLALNLFWAGACGKAQKETTGKEKKAAVSRPSGMEAARPADVAGKSDKEARPAGQPSEDVVDGTEPQMATVSVGSPIDSKSYKLSLSGPAKWEKGKSAVYELTLVPKNPYHSNKLFPFKLTFDKVPTGIKLDKTVFAKKDAALFSPEKVTFKVTVTPGAAGPNQVSGVYKFSVCTPKFCETPKARVLLKPAAPKPAGGKAPAVKH